MRNMIFAVIAMATAAFASADGAAADEWKKLLAPADLAALADEPLILDIRPPSSFARGHIEGAVNAPYGLWRGPRENPGRRLSDAALNQVLRQSGVERDRPVVVTFHGKGASDFGSAARVYWTLKSAGISKIAILNGGLTAWVQAGLPLSQTPTKIAPSTIDAQLSDRWMLDADGVQAVLDGKVNARLVDARPLGFFDGRNKHPAAAKAGTLRGALRVLHSSWFGERGAVMASTPAVVRQIVANAGYDAGQADGQMLVSFCNTGHWAATNWFALSEVAGIENVKLYPESMVGWSNRGGEVVAGHEG
ncbi:MAG: sulfurtransferase [Pikeienuella sp.]